MSPDPALKLRAENAGLRAELRDLQDRFQQVESERDGYKEQAEYLQYLPETVAALERRRRLQ